MLDIAAGQLISVPDEDPAVDSNLESVSDAAAPQAPHAFPTRRSSDLLDRARDDDRGRRRGRPLGRREAHVRRRLVLHDALPRSEEHTSELQSRRELVCRLLLEKKNVYNMSDRRI